MSDYLQRHHKFWPRKSYKTQLEKAFRNLPCNIARVTAEVHREIHRTHPRGNPEGKPSKDDMRRAIHNHIEGRCPCQSQPAQLQLF